MTQGAGQGPEVVRTETLRDFRVPAYVHETGPYAQSTPPDEVTGPVAEPRATLRVTRRGTRPPSATCRSSIEVTRFR